MVVEKILEFWAIFPSNRRFALLVGAAGTRKLTETLLSIAVELWPWPEIPPLVIAPNETAAVPEVKKKNRI